MRTIDHPHETTAQTAARRGHARARQRRFRAARRAGHPKQTAMVIAQHQRMLAHVEEFVFLTTVMGMSHLAAAKRLGYSEHTMDRWLRLVAAHPELGYWHAAPRDEATGQCLLPSVLDCPRNHDTVGAR
jgi:hypothetical protein